MDRSVLETTNGCGDHPVDVKADEIAKVVATRQWCSCEVGGGEPCHSYCDSYGAAVYLLKDGKYAVVTEQSDTSGHG